MALVLMAANNHPDASIYAQISHIYRVTRHPAFVNLDIEQRKQQTNSYWTYLKNNPNWPSSFEHFKTEHKRYLDLIEGNSVYFPSNAYSANVFSTLNLCNIDKNR